MSVYTFPSFSRLLRILVACCAWSLLAACSLIRPPEQIAVPTPTSWSTATLPHQGQTAKLSEWWLRFRDPVLVRMINAAQEQSPSIAQARAQIFAVRVLHSQAIDVLLPRVNAQYSLSRSATIPYGAPERISAQMRSIGVQAAWEPGLWGQSFSYLAAVNAQRDSANAGWHEARVLVAANLAQQYFAYRLCLQHVQLSGADRDSRQSSAALSVRSADAGFATAAAMALSSAAAAESAQRYTLQKSLCERQLKALVALTGIAEAELGELISRAPPLLPAQELSQLLYVQQVPAAVIAQRPDVYRAQRELIVASHQVGIARTALLPSLSFSGYLTKSHTVFGTGSRDANTWSVGPLVLNLPLLGRSGLYAGVDSARAAYEAAAKAYVASVRGAVRDVEQNLLSLAGMAERHDNAVVAHQAYLRSHQASERKYQAGLASRSEVEEARRAQINAENSLLASQEERINAWINLYLALGGGFDPQQSRNDDEVLSAASLPTMSEDAASANSVNSSSSNAANRPADHSGTRP